MATQEHIFLKNGRRIFFANGLDANSENQPVGQIGLFKSLKRCQISPCERMTVIASMRDERCRRRERPRLLHGTRARPALIRSVMQSTFL
jgi:hypothetical protein